MSCSKKVNSRLYVDDVECVCTGAGALQPSRNSFTFLKNVFDVVMTMTAVPLQSKRIMMFNIITNAFSEM